MGQSPNPSRVPASMSFALRNRIRSSPRKLNLVAQLIRNKPVRQALEDLRFCSRRVAVEVKKTLDSAIANAQNNFNLDETKLYVQRAVSGKSLRLKRFRARAKGRGARIHKEFSRLEIIVGERDTDGTKS